MSKYSRTWTKKVEKNWHIALFAAIAAKVIARRIGFEPRGCGKCPARVHCSALMPDEAVVCELSEAEVAMLLAGDWRIVARPIEFATINQLQMSTELIGIAGHVEPAPKPIRAAKVSPQDAGQMALPMAA